VYGPPDDQLAHRLAPMSAEFGPVPNAHAA
jgi:hypothetical protein